MNIYNKINEGKLSAHEKLDLNNEIYAIASNSIDKIAMGGEERKVDIYTSGKDG